MVLTLSSKLCVCRVKLPSAKWFHNSFFQFSLAFNCWELYHTVHAAVCYVVHSLQHQMSYAVHSQIKFPEIHWVEKREWFWPKAELKSWNPFTLWQNHFAFIHSVSVGTIPLFWFKWLQERVLHDCSHHDPTLQELENRTLQLFSTSLQGRLVALTHKSPRDESSM